MEDIPEVYRRPYDPKRPVVCLDEQPVQLIQETRWPLPVEPGQPVRYDDEYERAGTAVNFMLTESLGGRRQVRVRTTKTAIDLAQEVKTLLDVDDPDAEPVVQFEHPHPGLAVQSFSTRGSAAFARPLGDPLHAQTWQLVGHRRDRTERLYQAMPQPTHPGSGNAPPRGHRLGRAA